MKKEKIKIHPVMVILFLLYMLLLFYLLFFSETYGRTMIEREYRYNLELFKEIKRFWKNRETLGWSSVVTNLIGNIVAFAPFGFFMPMFSKIGQKLPGCLLVSAVFSAVVEAVQLVTKVGAFDVDDIFLNAIGGLVGFLCYYLIWRPLAEKRQKKKRRSV